MTRAEACRGTPCRLPPLPANNSCMPTQMPITGWVSVGDHERRGPSRAVVRMQRPRLPRRAGPRVRRGRNSPSGRELRRNAEPGEREARPTRGWRRPVGDDRDVASSQRTPLLLGNSTPSTAGPGAARGPAFEAGLDHVVRVLTRDLDVQGRQRLSHSDRKKCGTSSVGRPPTDSRRTCPRRRSTARPEKSSAALAWVSSMGRVKP